MSFASVFASSTASIEVPELVDEPELLRLGAGEHPAVGDRADLLLVELPPLGDRREELRVDPVDERLPVGAVLGGHLTERVAGVLQLAALHGLELDVEASASPFTLGNCEMTPMDPVSVPGSATIFGQATAT